MSWTFNQGFWAIHGSASSARGAYLEKARKGFKDPQGFLRSLFEGAEIRGLRFRDFGFWVPAPPVQQQQAQAPLQGAGMFARFMQP